MTDENTVIPAEAAGVRREAELLETGVSLGELELEREKISLEREKLAHEKDKLALEREKHSSVMSIRGHELKFYFSPLATIFVTALACALGLGLGHIVSGRGGRGETTEGVPSPILLQALSSLQEGADFGTTLSNATARAHEGGTPIMLKSVEGEEGSEKTTYFLIFR